MGFCAAFDPKMLAANGEGKQTLTEHGCVLLIPAVKPLGICADVRIAMRRQGLTGPELARHLGYHPCYVKLVIMGRVTSGKARQAIEDFLGQAFWSSPGDFAARQSDRTKTPATT